MSVNISYMGTKKELASAVSQVIGAAQPGAILDVFSGMCAVGESVATRRQVWTNDVQSFAHLVGSVLFTSIDEPLRPVNVADVHFAWYISQRHILVSLFERAVEVEVALLELEDFDAFEAQHTILKRTISDILPKLPESLSHCLFSRIYANTFFGVSQVIEIDAIVCSIHSAYEAGQLSKDQRGWLLIGLGRAMLRVSNSPGHFAQYLKPKLGSFRTFKRQRRRSIWVEWLAAADEMSPIGTPDWRRHNRSFNQDALPLLTNLFDEDEWPSVVYADPPYTEDHYSRYYHILETLILYDYPKVTGAGLYRPGRFQTPFSIKSKANAALENLMRSTARLGADIVFSYPSNGLLYKSGVSPVQLLKRYFGNVECCYSLSHAHSTFGASKGSAKSVVEEQIFVGRL